MRLILIIGKDRSKRKLRLQRFEKTGTTSKRYYQQMTYTMVIGIQTTQELSRYYGSQQLHLKLWVISKSHFRSLLCLLFDVLIFSNMSGYDQFPPAVNGWGTKYHIPDMASPLLTEEEGPPT
jgi:hypothetical protein